MKKVSILLVLWAGFLLSFACDQEPQKQPCQADHNCDTRTQGCYQGFCTPLTAIPHQKDEPKATKEPTATPDANQSSREAPPEPRSTDTPPAPMSYPKGPYGADVDDVAIPLDNLPTCDGKGKVNLKDYYKHAKIKMLQITVHTGWCPSCRTQAQGLEAIYQKYKAKGLGILYIMTEDNRQGSGQISGAYCVAHTNKYGFTFPSVIDPGSAQMRKYFDRNAVPLNILLSTADMKIRYKKSGALPTRMNGIIESYLQ